MSTSPLSVMVLLPPVALAFVAGCDPVVRQFSGTGGAGGASTATAGGQPPSGLSTATSSDASASSSNSSSGDSSSSGASTGSGACGDTQSDPNNCGSCGVHCSPTQKCGQGACADNFTSCAETGSCFDPMCQVAMRFSVDPDVVVDTAKGRRLWQRATGGPLDYAAAGAYCASLSLDAVTGWRLPTGSELTSLLVHPGGLMGCSAGYCSPAIDQAAFPGTLEGKEYWTTDPYMSGMHYCVSFCDGRVSPYKTDDSAPELVRCVHDPLP